MISFYMQAILLLRRPPCWNKHDARHATSCLSCRDATSGIWAFLEQFATRLRKATLSYSGFRRSL